MKLENKTTGILARTSNCLHPSIRHFCRECASLYVTLSSAVVAKHGISVDLVGGQKSRR